MEQKQLKERVEAILSDLVARELEERIAPVKCDKNPDAPGCEPMVKYGIPTDE